MNDSVNFCMRCGAPLERREQFGQLRPTCPRCGWIFFADPKVAAGVLVETGQGVLLVRRVNEPGRGLWTFPAGFVDAYEDPARAAERECLEETGLRVTVTGLLRLVAGREHPRGADIVLIYTATVAIPANLELLPAVPGADCATGGTLVPGDDADQAGFFLRSALPPLAFRATRLALGLPE